MDLTLETENAWCWCLLCGCCLPIICVPASADPWSSMMRGILSNNPQMHHRFPVNVPDRVQPIVISQTNVFCIIFTARTIACGWILWMVDLLDVDWYLYEQTERQTDGQADEQTDRKTNILSAKLTFEMLTVHEWRQSFSTDKWLLFMMTSLNGNIFRVTGPLCGEFTGHRWIPRTKASDAKLWCVLWFGP